jgi:translation initiation factor 1 (eIF-1/SUI1)
MPELTATLTAIRERENNHNKFLAAIQGIDLDGSESQETKGQKEWEDIKARVFSGGTAKDSNDITSLQGINASQAGFGIGAGLSYDNLGNQGGGWS